MKAQSNSSKFYIPQFKLDSGELLENVEIAYTTEGKLSESRDNAILVFHALTGSHMLAGSYQQLDNPDIPWNEELETGWWDGFVGVPAEAASGLLRQRAQGEANASRRPVALR